MTRYIVAMLAVFALAACSTTPAQSNMNRLAAAEATYGTALVGANLYAHRPLCAPGSTITPTNICADRGVIATMQAADRSAIAAITAAHTALIANPSDSVVVLLVGSAEAAVGAFSAVAPKP